MSNIFSKNKNNSEEQAEDILSKLYENNNITNKLDFNVEYLNTYLVKAITSFYNARYNQDNETYTKYITENCKKELEDDINREMSQYKYSNFRLEIKSIDIVYQNMQSVNYISDLIIEVKVFLVYYKENILSSIVREVREEYAQKLWFILKDGGWTIEKYYNREYAYSDDEKIISM